MCSAKKLTLLFLYSSLPGQPSTQPAAQPAIQPSNILLPSWACPDRLITGNLQESSGLVRLWHNFVPKMIRKHQPETCEFIDLHLKLGPDNQIIYLHKRKIEGGGQSIKQCCCS